jgi:outer membrane protein OmpA-like peptidoglycan-associated protein
LWPPENISGQDFSNSRCAQLNGIADQRYTLIHVPKLQAYMSIHAFQFTGGTFCNAIKGRTISIVDIVQVEELEAEFVTVQAEEMAAEISGTGKIALYGILFDTAKADVKLESTATLSQIAGLLTGDPALRLLIVGHTDTQGSYDHNLDLSRRRAASVVQSLASDHGIARERLFPVGVSFASPVASNATEEGRAKNRRVELVSF